MQTALKPDAAHGGRSGRAHPERDGPVGSGPAGGLAATARWTPSTGHVLGRAPWGHPREAATRSSRPTAVRAAGQLGVCGQLRTVPGSFSRCPQIFLCVFTSERNGELGAEGLCSFAFVIALRTYLRLIELITDKTVFSLPAGAGTQLLIAEIPSPHVTSQSVLAGLQSLGKSVGRGVPRESWETARLSPALPSRGFSGVMGAKPA